MKKKFELPELDYKVVADLIVPVIGPFVQAGIWYGFSKIDKNAALMNKLIAVGEVIPAIDLGLPKGVTLAALYDTVDDTLELLLELIKGIKEIPSAVEDAVKDFIKAAKPTLPSFSDLTDDAFPDLESKQKFLADYNECLAGYTRDIPTLARNEITKQAYLLSCLTQKGYGRQLLAPILGIIG
jgi:hypothetical protein